jgi:hypothetical protein
MCSAWDQPKGMGEHQSVYFVCFLSCILIFFQRTKVSVACAETIFTLRPDGPERQVLLVVGNWCATTNNYSLCAGMRNSSQILIFINIAAAMAAGILFHLSANGVLLTAGDSRGYIPPAYFSSVERKVGDKWEPIPLVEEKPDADTLVEQVSPASN